MTTDGKRSESGKAPRAPAIAAATVIQPQHLYKAVGLLFLFLIVHSQFTAIARVLLMVYGSAIIAVALNVLVSLIPRHRRLVSLALGVVIFGGLGVALWVGIPALGGQLRGLAGELPALEVKLEQWSSWLRDWTGINIELYGEQTRAFLSDIVGGAGGLGRAMSVVEGVFLPFVLLVGALYAVAKPNELLLNPVLHVVPRDKRDSFRRLFLILGERLRGWVKGTLFSMLAVGVLTTIGLWILGVRYALLLGLIAAVLEIVPIFGPWVAGTIAVSVAFIDDPTQGFWVVLLMLAIQQVESNLIMPMVMARTAEVHPFITVFALIFFGSLFGFLGIILALPLVLLIWTVMEVLWVDRAIDADGDTIEPVVKEA